MGALTVITKDPAVTTRVESQLKQVPPLPPALWQLSKWLQLSRLATRELLLPGVRVCAESGPLLQVIRRMYSSPPAHGASIATAVLADPQLFQVRATSPPRRPCEPPRPRFTRNLGHRQYEPLK